MNQIAEVECPSSDDLNCSSVQMLIENASATKTPEISTTSSTSTSTLFTKYSHSDVCAKKRRSENAERKFNCAKIALLQSSNISGENLYDHLCTIIRRVLDQRPENVVDYFEEYSRNVREQKFNVIEKFSKCYFVEPTFFEAAEDILASVKLPPPCDETDTCEEGGEVECEVKVTPTINRVERSLIWNENVLLSQFYWSLCGFGFQFDEVFQLSWVLQKLQFHPTVEHCRFWGKIYGLKNNYFIAEVTFTQMEIERRNEKYKTELEFKSLRDPNSLKPIVKPELEPGTKWKNLPKWELAKMKPVGPVPLPNLEEEFNIPPEAFGSGVNRKSYFVLTSLTEEWIELPLLTNKHISVARKIRKYFTGNLEALLFSYPRFPGCEKHLLRATIARISCGTFIAPNGFYRKQTKRDLFNGEEEDEEEEEEEEEDEEDEKIKNDIVLVRNEKYKPIEAPDIESFANWVHVRPNILDKQGRVNFFNQSKAIKELLRKRKLEELAEGEEGEVETEEEEEEDEDEDTPVDIEVGPPIFTPCNEDNAKMLTSVWTARYSAQHNVLNLVRVMRSNLWPGSYSFASDRMADSIYLGWGHKYVSRNFSPTHIPNVQQEFKIKPEVSETVDPTPSVFEKYQKARKLRKNRKKLNENVDEE